MDLILNFESKRIRKSVVIEVFMCVLKVVMRIGCGCSWICDFIRDGDGDVLLPLSNLPTVRSQ